MVLVLFFPESPRWLIAHDRSDEALAILAKYHGEGDPSSALVQLQYREIVEDNALTGIENPWWDFRELANTREARYRLAMVIAMAFFGQWSGNNVVSYFMVSLCILDITRTAALVGYIMLTFRHSPRWSSLPASSTLISSF